jgi:D-3-phosphoglycerate dehydrogenase
MVENLHRVVLLTTEDSQIHSIAEEILKENFQVRHVMSPGRSFDEKMLMDVRNADAILVRTGVVSREVMDAAPELKVIAVHGIGMDRVDLEEAEARGIVVTNTPLANTVAVAEHTMGLILSLIRRIPLSDQLVREGRWGEARFVGSLLSKMTVGILGFGNIGTKVAKRLNAFETRILSYDPYVPLERFEELGVESVELETLLRESDIITIHLPLTKHTCHIIGDKEIKMMKSGVLIVNTSRGAVLDERVLSVGLREGWISGAALDVFETEPFSLDNPLLGSKNVVLTPHVAGSTGESLRRMAETAAKDIVRVLKGERPLHEYQRELLPYPV